VSDPDNVDQRIARAVAAYRARMADAGPRSNPTVLPRGFDTAEVEQAIAAAGGDPQEGWNRVLAAYFDVDISLGRAAELLGLSRLKLAYRFQWLGVPPPAVCDDTADVWTWFDSQAD
jgi:hypothetical protein